MTRGRDEVRPILFLDRDGVIVEEVGYLHRIDDVRFIDGVSRTILSARSEGWLVALVTNQAGIGRNLYGWKEFVTVNSYILDWLDCQGAVIDAVLAVPHHPDGVGEYRHPNHPMRKPNPGMFQTAAEMLNGDLSHSLVIGDNSTDLLAAKRSGLRRAFAVLTGHGSRYRAKSVALSSRTFAVTVVPDVGDTSVLNALKSKKLENLET